MAKQIRPGDTINGYTIESHINTGAMAIAYAATNRAGEKVFFKQYKSPSVTVSWYRDYVKYQQELKRRVDGNRVRNFSYRMIEFFEHKWGCQTFFQVFEFVHGGEDMEKVLDQVRTRPKTITVEQRLILAKVMMAGVFALHEARIIHCDLKPPNLQLFRDASIKAGYQLKLIDMDFSILSDRRAPWHGQAGYVGSPHYLSPEHVTGKVPLPASDVFTCGLILYELLGAGHPYREADDEAYTKMVCSRAAAPPRLAGVLPDPAANDRLMQCLYRCLSPNPSERPTAQEVNLALNGRTEAPVRPPTPPVRPPVTPPPFPPTHEVIEKKPSRPGPTSGFPLELVGPGGRVLRFRIRTDVGSHLCNSLHEDARFFDARQFTIDRGGDGWILVPNPSARNQTLINGKPVERETPLAPGDVVAVGNVSKGVSKLPMTVRLGVDP